MPIIEVMKTEEPNIEFHNRGKIVIEKDNDTDTFLICFPNGEIQGASSVKAVKSFCKKYTKKNKPGTGQAYIYVLEWRNCAGLEKEIKHG